MFPEIVRDEVFRLETRRLWLRWPTMQDAFDAAGVGTNAMLGQGMVGAGLRLPGTACITAWRATMAAGDALHLMLEDKGSRTPVGSVHVTLTSRHGELDYQLASTRRGEGLMTEAVQAVVHGAFLLDATPAIAAAPLALDPGGRAVLERCGFTYVGSGMRNAGAGAGLAACDHFRLDRRTWSSLRGWGVPGVSGASRYGAEPARTAVGA